jgi:hypothetical protein
MSGHVGSSVFINERGKEKEEKKKSLGRSIHFSKAIKCMMSKGAKNILQWI